MISLGVLLPSILIIILVGVLVVLAESDQHWATFVLLVVIVLLSGRCGVTILDNQLKKECELNLPRNQVCKIIAIPEAIEVKTNE